MVESECLMLQEPAVRLENDGIHVWMCTAETSRPLYFGLAHHKCFTHFHLFLNGPFINIKNSRRIRCKLINGHLLCYYNPERDTPVPSTLKAQPWVCGLDHLGQNLDICVWGWGWGWSNGRGVIQRSSRQQIRLHETKVTTEYCSFIKLARGRRAQRNP